MKILISGICGFVGSVIARELLDRGQNVQLVGFDNFIRPGSEQNREELRARGVRLIHADVRSPSDMETLPAVDWIIDAAANPSVLAGIDGLTSSRQLLEHNLYGTVNLLELAKKHRAGCILLSTSRVYSIAPLAGLAVEEKERAYVPAEGKAMPVGLSGEGIAEEFSTAAPVSLYGATKLASECLALEYADAFGFPVWVNRCGVMAGAGQFGRADQGIFAFWVNSWLRGRPLKYIGFGGSGLQTRDAFHPRDIVSLLLDQMKGEAGTKPRIVNVGGGRRNAMSLAQLSEWCSARFGPRAIEREVTPRAFDVPWIVMDSRLAERVWHWQPVTALASILEEIAIHAEANPRWLEISAPL